MKQLLIGLLIIAAGTGIFFFVRNKKTNAQGESLNKDLIIGKWQTSQKGDSAAIVSSYDFTKEGLIIEVSTDSLKAADTSHYEWNKSNELVWKKTAADSASRTFSVIKLTQDTLQVRSKDSSTFLFTRTK
jgi:hypothetical protein